MYVTSANSLLVVENKTGRILMRKKLGEGVEVASTPLVTDDAIIFGTSTNGMVALDKETLEEKWRFKTREAMILSAPYQGNHPATVEASPVICGDQIYIGASDGTLYAIHAKTGRLQWRHHLGTPVFASLPNKPPQCLLPITTSFRLNANVATQPSPRIQPLFCQMISPVEALKAVN